MAAHQFLSKTKAKVIQTLKAWKKRENNSNNSSEKEYTSWASAA